MKNNIPSFILDTDSNQNNNYSIIEIKNIISLFFFILISK